MTIIFSVLFFFSSFFAGIVGDGSLSASQSSSPQTSMVITSPVRMSEGVGF